MSCLMLKMWIPVTCWKLAEAKEIPLEENKDLISATKPPKL